eukprot:TRINITY_DN2602_c0_g2_i1.p1 TRINITY_DN2602_c0_g2~~TRINITY_DN2602_c0_g2_i1.p1  ORF type:complete len:352 (+),score=35.49 TRINITY_DN2602_c0_g2_i1:3-1058(+)
MELNHKCHNLYSSSWLVTVIGQTGVDVAGSAKFSKSHTTSKRKTSKEYYAYLIWKCNLGTLRCIRITPTQDVLDQIANLVQLVGAKEPEINCNVGAFVSKYGSHICIQMDFGGMLIGKTETKFASEEEAKRFMTSAGAKLGAGMYSAAAGKVGIDTSIEHGHTESHFGETQAVTWEYYGGDQSTYSPFNPPAWLQSLKNKKEWAIIERVDVLRMDELLDDPILDLGRLEPHRQKLVQMFHQFLAPVQPSESPVEELQVDHPSVLARLIPRLFKHNEFKSHRFKRMTTTASTDWCFACKGFIYSGSGKGVLQCKDCGVAYHVRCRAAAKNNHCAEPTLKKQSKTHHSTDPHN